MSRQRPRKPKNKFQNNNQWHLINEEEIHDRDSRNNKRSRIIPYPSDGDMIGEERFFDAKKAPKTVKLTPRGKHQEDYLKNLLNPDISITFGIGPAGSGKTLLATQAAIKLLIEKKIEKIVITRPAVSVDEEHGFLPGSLEKKLEPWLMPILDILHEHYSVKEVQNMIKEKVIAIEPLAFMRGRTFKNSYIIADEMQNSLPSQMKMVLTRIGEGSQMVVTGDLKQHDRGFNTNGLLDFIERLEQKGSAAIRVNRFDKSDIQRHAIITEVLGLYGEED